ncbi:PE-PPE domain-containing protein [Gordonia phthalatica]|uniref:PE-PPE domain-containing protein n=1 Tax=Gordonia phthalatica TaxID=1136941 RepID=UPI001D05835A|nr:PE-PPE domain-containing protein [Gordonia phthalatica]
MAPIAAAPCGASPVANQIAYDGPAVVSSHDVLGNYVPGANRDTLVVVVPGTDDDRSPRIDGLVAGRDSLIVDYPESFWPIISGKSGRALPFLAPTYNRSRTVAADNTLAVMKALTGSDRTVVYTGYSQGSDALGNAAEQGMRQGLLRGNSTILLVSDPRGPWGIKSRASEMPNVAPLLAPMGVNDDGVRDPAATGDEKVVQVILQGDPVAHAQWDPTRPAASALVEAAGFVAIHSGTGDTSYARLDEVDHVKTLRSRDGNTTYEVYDTYHPLALVPAMALESIGLRVSDRQMRDWDRRAEAFYPTQAITAENADPKVEVTEVPLTPAAPQTTGVHGLMPRADRSQQRSRSTRPVVRVDQPSDARSARRSTLPGPRRGSASRTKTSRGAA